jgi:peptide/nickel transport system ATP-binding protein
MYGGKLVEFGGTVEIFKSACHPYTRGLLASFISVEGEKKELQSIPGENANLIFPPEGCRFRPRCPFAMEICKKTPELAEIKNKHYVACHLAG